MKLLMDTAWNREQRRRREVRDSVLFAVIFTVSVLSAIALLST
jgi:hypothetical protein